PCEGWTARDVVRHVVQTQGMFLGLVGRELGEVPSVDDDPAAAWRAASAVVRADLDVPERASAEFEGQLGRMTFEQSVERFLCFDLVVHRWDLARAAGLDERLPADEVRWVHGLVAGFGDALRGERVCGPELTPPEGADEQTRLLAFLGRRSW
ncbi:TIGR03086 family metal-binding protein, partial [Marinitenerispora sediminis]